jgi:hypothetical protein
MAKKSKTKATLSVSSAPAEKDISITRQAVGGVTGAVIGGMVAGPVGAIAGGVAGTIVGDQSARGKKPVARTAAAIGEEIRKGTPMKALKSVSGAATSLGRSPKKSAKSRKAAPATSAGRKKAKSTAPKKAAKKTKAKSAKTGAKAKKRAKKKGAKKR